jgi:hypothetical protein
MLQSRFDWKAAGAASERGMEDFRLADCRLKAAEHWRAFSQ